MNSTLPPGDSGRRGSATRRASRSPWSLSGVVRLGDGTEIDLGGAVAEGNEMSGTDSACPTLDRLVMAKRCLQLISDIAGRSAGCWNPEVVGYALQELTQVFLERTGTQERLFEPVPPDQIPDLGKLFEELDLVDSFSESMTAGTMN